MLNTRRLDTYENIRDEVVEIRRVGLYCSRGAVPVPTDLDPLGRSRGKPGYKGGGGKHAPSGGKGDGGKKGGKHGKGPRFDGYCSHCGKRGHKQADCCQLARDKAPVHGVEKESWDHEGEETAPGLGAIELGSLGRTAKARVCALGQL